MSADPAHSDHARYAGAQDLYAACRPADRATVVVSNTELSRPRVVRAPK